MPTRLEHVDPLVVVGAHLIIRFMGLHGGVMPDVFPELSRLRDTPTPQVVIAVKGDAMLLTRFLHEVVYLRGMRGRVPP